MITLSDTAIQAVQNRLRERTQGLGIRIGVKTTGCSGLAYMLEYVDAPSNTDIVSKFEGFCVYIDPKSSVYLEGLHVDYVKRGLNQGFEFVNPQEKARCGCGESFTV